MCLAKKFYVIAMAFLIVTLFSIEAKAEKKIGIFLFTKEVRYLEPQKGIMDQLEKDGFGKSAVKYTIENAEGSKAKAAEIARKFSVAKMDLIITIGTQATLAAKEIKDVPIVFSTVYDPVESGIAKSWKSSGNNTTGASTKIPMSIIMKTLKEIGPIKKLAVIYTPGEKNSEAQLIELQKNQADFQIKIIPIILTKKEETVQTISEIIRTVDALYLTGSSIVGEKTIPTIVDIANKAHVISITHLDDVVKNGALLGVCSNPYQLGRLAGKKAVKILKGAKPSSIPIETTKKSI